MRKTMIVLMLLVSGFTVQAAEASGTKEAWELAGVPDFKSFSNVKAKKDAFFRYLLPIVTAENARIMKIRERLVSLQKQKDNISPEDKTWLENVGKKYRVRDVTGSAWHQEMLSRVDVIPPSLAMAMASYESGWGTSRFARQGNNLFGQMCYTKGCGFVPRQRNAGGTRELAKYKTVNESVRAYMYNLNSHPSYTLLRTLRARQRSATQSVTGHEVANGLVKYSTRGQAYVKEVQNMIRINRLAQFDDEPTTAKIPG